MYFSTETDGYVKWFHVMGLKCISRLFWTIALIIQLHRLSTNKHILNVTSAQ